LFSHADGGNTEVFDSRSLRIIFGPKKQKVTRGRRKLHNKLRHLFVLLTIKIKSKSKRRTRHVNGKENRNVSYMMFWWENLK
jgi:hypothetical protein